MREWAKLLLSVNPNFGDEHGYVTFRKSFTLQNNLPPDYSTSQSQPSSIQMLLKTSTFQITHILRKHHAYALKPQHLTLHPHYPTMQAPQYETPLHQVPWALCTSHAISKPSISNVSVPKVSYAISFGTTSDLILV